MQPTLDNQNRAAGEAQLAEAAPAVEELPALIESLLFVAGEPATVAQLAGVLGVSAEVIETALEQMTACYHAGGRGLRLQRKNDRLQLVTAPEAAPYIERFLGIDLSTTLSTAALETLAVIAYRQPVTRGDVEAVRGVSCDGVMRTLVSRGLVEPVGRLEQAGRPFLYGTTFQFLQHLGLESLQALPPLPGDEAPAAGGGEQPREESSGEAAA